MLGFAIKFRESPMKFGDEAGELGMLAGEQFDRPAGHVFSSGLVERDQSGFLVFDMELEIAFVVFETR